MTIRTVYLLNALLLCTIFCSAAAGTYTKTKDGIIVYTDAAIAGNTKQVRLAVIADNIIRVTASPSDNPEEIKSLIASYDHSTIPAWTVAEEGGNIRLSTSLVVATVRKDNGAVSFTDKAGKPILAERQNNGRSFEPAVFEGKASYTIKQVYETTADDAYYGLGQHQDDVYDYKGQQVFLFQNNTEVAVPFLVSAKNYGLLWDQYAVSWFGDTRPYQPISSLKLYSQNNEEGWLTASYCNDKNNPAKVDFTKAESAINYEFLGDSKQLPAAFNIGNGMLRWEGSVESPFTGVHKFRFTYAGYLKIWLDGKLVADRWRQAWNPGVAQINPQMEKGRKYAIKIEWIPDGGESYISAKWLSPVPAKDQDSYGFEAEAGQQLDYYFIYGNNMDQVIAGYRSLTGKATLLPKWTLGFWQSRERYKTQDEILSTVEEFRKRRIPLDNIVQDWSYWKQDAWGSQEFDASRFPNPDSMISVLHKKYNTHFMISVWPKFYEGIPTYKQFNDSGWLYTRNIADRQRDWIGQGYISTFYDAFNPAAQKAFWELLNSRLYKKGVDAWWMDASEPDILSNVSYQKRKQQMSPLYTGIAAENLNAYPMENAKGIYEGQRAANPNDRVFILTRSAFAGSQRYAAATWSGDIGARWTDMKAQITAGLNFSMSGIPYWTMDIGGFAVEHRYEKPNDKDLEEWREQTTRWYQFGAFCPLFRSHGQFPFREIYNTAPPEHPAYKSMLYYDQLRYRLMPYIYAVAGAAYHKDYTIMRGLVMDFAADTAVRSISDQYLFGPSLLINPVYTFHATDRSVYLPAGQGWYDLYTGKFEEGGRRINAAAPYERMPVYVKEGSVIPVGPDLQYTAEKPADPITLFVYTGKDASFSLYEDEGINYNYEKGAYSNININYSEQDKTLTIGKREGSFSGMLAKRTFRVVFIAKDKAKALDPVLQADATVVYKGEAVMVKMK
ncbi:MAG TPA: glycoside hydrolase family 31 protein [Panacibacter sp.]|nr:glycoside hydrolase family 31 protein [Panacibacter sp.]HNP46517.1 glycoside hydrolase family 31 protein [Panacibacter sp.]